MTRYIFQNHYFYLIVGSLLLLASCTQKTEVAPAISVIPEPVESQLKSGAFTLDRNTSIIADTTDRDVQKIAQQLRAHIESAIGYPVAIKTEKGSGSKNVMILTKKQIAALDEHESGYQLNVSDGEVNIAAPSGEGLFYGMQTLLQLLPHQIYQTDYTLVPRNTEWKIPALEITDFPRFAYRGMHLDVGRYFFPVAYIKRYIDIMAMH